jgi:hypothetical protein
VDEITTVELRRVLAALHDAGIRPLLFKGAALAFSHYPDPSLRPRADADLLVYPDAIASACAILERLDYRRVPYVSGEFVMFQVPYMKTDERGLQHAVDLHWKICNPLVLAGAFTHEELWARAVALPALGEAPRAAGAVDALALACVHRAAHHGPAMNEDRLIWFYDIHLLAERLHSAEEEAFVRLVRTKQLAAVCADGLAASARSFRGRVADKLATRLRPHGSVTHEPSEVYVSGRMRKVDVLRSDLNALPGWRARLVLLREHLFPPANYMRKVYGETNSAVLPFYYALRIVRGAREWCRRVR